MINIMDLSYSELIVKQKRKKIYRLAKAYEKDNGFSNFLIEYILILYDNEFLEGFLFYNHINVDCKISNRLKKSAGITKYRIIKQKSNIVKEFKIIIAKELFNNFDREKKHMVCGNLPDNSFEAMLYVIEHELCHIIEFYFFGKSSCKRSRFKKMSYNIFKHISSVHNIPSIYSKNAGEIGIDIGSKISFVDNGIEKKGKIINVGPKVTVIVESKYGKWISNDKKRYDKQKILFSDIKGVINNG